MPIDKEFCVMSKNFIKIADPEIASNLVALGFQYIKEQDCFSFIQTEDLMSAIHQLYSSFQFVEENKLRF